MRGGAKKKKKMAVTLSGMSNRQGGGEWEEDPLGKSFERSERSIQAAEKKKGETTLRPFKKGSNIGGRRQ